MPKHYIFSTPTGPSGGKKNTVLLPVLLKSNIVPPDLANAIPAVHLFSGSYSIPLNG